MILLAKRCTGCALASGVMVGVLLAEPVAAQASPHTVRPPALIGTPSEESLPCGAGSAACTPKNPYHDNCSDPWLAIAGLTPALVAAGVPVPPHLPIPVAWGHNNFQSACRRHDHCYHHGYCSYGKTRPQCDTDFRNDMRAKCNSLSSLNPEKPVCYEAAGLFYVGVSWAPEAARSYLGANGYFNCYAGAAGCKLRASEAALMMGWW